LSSPLTAASEQVSTDPSWTTLVRSHPPFFRLPLLFSFTLNSVTTFCQSFSCFQFDSNHKISLVSPVVSSRFSRVNLGVITQIRRFMCAVLTIAVACFCFRNGLCFLFCYGFRGL